MPSHSALRRAVGAPLSRPGSATRSGDGEACTHTALSGQRRPENIVQRQGGSAGGATTEEP
jgi:hypothetical protein